MNKLYLVVSVLFISVHATNWAMLTVNKIQTRVSNKYFTQEKIEKYERRVSEESQAFLNSFGQHSMNKTGTMFCDLSIRAKQRVLSCLSHNQKMLVWFGANDLAIPFLSAVLNGCEKVAIIYSQKPVGEILEAYASAKEMMKWCPLFTEGGKIGVLEEQHYMALKNRERVELFDVDNRSGLFIYQSEVPLLMSALKALVRADPEVVDIERLTGQLKMYPSWSERGRIFYSMIPHGSLNEGLLMLSLAFGIRASIVLDVAKTFDNYVPALEVLHFVAKNIAFPSVPAFWFCIACRTYFIRYRNHLKTNILPNQPTLKDCLKKIAS